MGHSDRWKIVGLAGEHGEGIVLRLPAEARSRAVVSVAVGMSGGCFGRLRRKSRFMLGRKKLSFGPAPGEKTSADN
jgi:hypothetical protein